jgi:DNA-binding Lrp family transcriptional regulator
MGQPALWIVDEHGELISNTRQALAANREPIRQAALTYHEKDELSLLMIRPVFRAFGKEHIPAPNEKTPYYVWAGLQARRQRRETLETLLEKYPDGQIAALCGLASENLYGLDCDSQEMFAYVQERNPFATRIIASRRGGTLLFRAPFAVKTRKGITLPGVEGRLDILGQGSYQLLPPSYHPTGILYKTLRTAAIVELDKADLEAFQWLSLEPADIGWRKPDRIPDRAWRILRGYYLHDEFNSKRSGAEHACVIQLVASGLSFDEIIEIFFNHAHKDSKFREIFERQGHKAATNYIRQSFDKAGCWLTKQAQEMPITLAKLRAWADSADWSGPGGSSLKIIFLQLLNYADQAHHTQFSFAQRRLAIDIGLERQTVNNRIADLCKRKLLTRVRKNIGQRAALFRFHPDLIARVRMAEEAKGEGTANSTDARKQVLLAVPGTLPGEDVFRASQAGGLGKEAALVWIELRQVSAGLTSHDLRERTKRDIKTVRKALRRFVELGMAIVGGHRENSKERIYVAVPGINLEDVAQRLGVAGRAVAQYERIEAERTRYRRETMRRKPVTSEKNA